MKTDKMKKNFNVMLWTVTGLICLILPIVSLIIDPLYLFVKHMTRISEGSPLYELMKQEVEGAYIYAYVFNITNPEEFLAGKDKLRVEEVGPFTYQEYRRVEDLELDEEEGVVRYTLRTRARFLPEKSIADPRTVNVSVVNFVSLAIANKVSSMTFFTRTGFNILLNRVKCKPIINISVQELLWEYDEPLISLSQSFLPWMNIGPLGILEKLLDKNLKTRIEMNIRGQDKFKIMTVNKSPGLLSRGYDSPSKRTRCNTFNDTYEGFAFANRLTPDIPIRIYRESACRILDFKYSNTEVLDYGPKVHRYKLDNNTYSTSPATECLCSSHCLQGVSDLSPCCHGFSLALSNGHFLHADKSLYDGIIGMNPNEELHSSEIAVDVMSGMTVTTKLVLQLNVMAEDVGFSKIFKSFSNMVVPIAYLKVIQPEFNEDKKMKIKLLYVFGPYAIHTIELALFTVGVTILLYITYIKLNSPLSHRNNNITYEYHIPGAETDKVHTDALTLKILDS